MKRKRKPDIWISPPRLSWSFIQEKAEEFRAMAGDEEESLIEAISGVICNKYEVSRDVIQRRIRIEKLKI